MSFCNNTRQNVAQHQKHAAYAAQGFPGQNQQVFRIFHIASLLYYIKCTECTGCEVKQLFLSLNNVFYVSLIRLNLDIIKSSAEYHM